MAEVTLLAVRGRDAALWVEAAGRAAMAVERERVALRAAVVAVVDTARLPGADAIERCKPLERATGFAGAFPGTMREGVAAELAAGGRTLEPRVDLEATPERMPVPVPASRDVVAGRDATLEWTVAIFVPTWDACGAVPTSSVTGTSGQGSSSSLSSARGGRDQIVLHLPFHRCHFDIAEVVRSASSDTSCRKA